MQTRDRGDGVLPQESRRPAVPAWVRVGTARDRSIRPMTSRWAVVRRRTVIGLAGLAIVVTLDAGTDRGGYAPGLAAHATPIVDQACTSPPLTMDAVERLATSFASPLPTRTPGLVPKGTSATAEDRAVVAEIVGQFIACSNAGEPSRVHALYTRAYAASVLGLNLGFDPDAVAAMATPRPAAPGTETRLVSITGIRRLIGERLGALVTIDYAVIPGSKRFFFTFREEAGRWRIDDVLGELSFSLP